jgi:hypothetical protein
MDDDRIAINFGQPFVASYQATLVRGALVLVAPARPDFNSFVSLLDAPATFSIGTPA